MVKCIYCYQPIEQGDFHTSCSKTFFGANIPPKMDYSLNDMNVLAKRVIERSIAVPGVQPKLSLSVIHRAQKNAHARLTVVGALGGQYIFKPPSERFPEMPENEHLTMRIAESFGIRVAPSSLIRLASGELAYITRRIDRTKNNEKIHMLDMFQITEAADKYRSSLEKIGKAIEQHSDRTLLDQVFFFELVIFSFITGNNDMHLKNFSMIHGEFGWELAPAYDLLNVAIVLPNDKEELALTLAGKKRRLQRFHFEQLGEALGLNSKQISSVFLRMQKNKSKALRWIERSFLSNEMKAAYASIVESRYLQLGLSDYK